MQVSIEALNGLKRKVRISVPTEKVEEEVSQRLRSLARKVKMDGFRPGKVPYHVVKTRYVHSVLEEVARDMVQPTLHEALKENNLFPASSPTIEPEQVEPGKDFIYTAEFEVFPKIDIIELDNNVEIEIIQAKVSDNDVKEMIERLREQNKDWAEVNRPAEKDDKVVIDYEGSIDDKPFEAGKADDYELVLGSGSMIAGFEEGLIGAEKEKPVEIKATFPADYAHLELAGKEALFKVKIRKVMEGKLPPLDESFAAKFNIKEGGMEALTKDVQANMVRELERRVSSINREKIFEKFMETNVIELPTALIDREITNMKHELYHRLFGHEHSDNEQIPDFPRSLFEDRAKSRVHLGLLFSTYIKKHELVVSKEHVDALIEKFASAYEKPEELRAFYHGSKEHIAEVEAMAMEDLVAEKISGNAKLTEKTKKYNEVMNPIQDSTTKGE